MSRTPQRAAPRLDLSSPASLEHGLDRMERRRREIYLRACRAGGTEPRPEPRSPRRRLDLPTPSNLAAEFSSVASAPAAPEADLLESLSWSNFELRKEQAELRRRLKRLSDARLAGREQAVGATHVVGRLEERNALTLRRATFALWKLHTQAECARREQGLRKVRQMLDRRQSGHVFKQWAARARLRREREERGQHWEAVSLSSPAPPPPPPLGVTPLTPVRGAATPANCTVGWSPALSSPASPGSPRARAAALDHSLRRAASPFRQRQRQRPGRPQQREHSPWRKPPAPYQPVVVGPLAHEEPTHSPDEKQPWTSVSEFFHPPPAMS